MILRILYRFLISYLLATLMGGLVAAIAIGIAIGWFGDFDSALREIKEANGFKIVFASLFFSAIGTMVSTFIGGLVRATATPADFRKAIYREIVPASIIATFIGTLLGFVYFSLASAQPQPEPLFILDGLAGIFGLAIIWWVNLRVRNKRTS